MKLGLFYMPDRAAQHPGMGAEFYEASSAFRAALDGLQSRCDFDLQARLLHRRGGRSESDRIHPALHGGLRRGRDRAAGGAGHRPRLLPPASLWASTPPSTPPGSLTPSTAVELAAFRGKAMARKPQPDGTSAMVAVLGLDRAALQECL